MPRIRYTLCENVGDPSEWSLTWEMSDDVTLSSMCGFCGRGDLRLTYEVSRATEPRWICPLCVARYPIAASLDGLPLDPGETRDHVHGLTARLKQRTCQEAIRRIQGFMNDPALDEILVYFERHLQLSPRRAAHLFRAVRLTGELMDPRIFEVRTRSTAHQDEFGALDEAARAMVWPALSPVQRRRLAARGYAPPGALARRTGGRSVQLAPPS